MLAAIDAERLEGAALEEATRRLDVDGSGFVQIEAFLVWFKQEEATDPVPEVHPSVAAGLKEEGEVGGPGLLYDASLSEAPAPGPPAP